MTAAGLSVQRTESRTGTVAFPSIDAFVAAEVHGTPIGAVFGDRRDDIYPRLLAAARDEIRTTGDLAR